MAFLLKGMLMKNLLKTGLKRGAKKTAKTGSKRSIGLASAAIPLLAKTAVPIYGASKLEDQLDDKVKQVLPYAIGGIGLIVGTVLIITLSR
jgi:hypothetical protein